MSSKQSLVITSISPPNPVLCTCAEECDKRGVDFIVIGDVASPPDFSLDGCNFWSIDRQKKLDFKLAEILPVRHYARKNIGYLIAIRNGSEIIIETDDDNFPLESFWKRKSPVQMATLIEDKGWVNVFRYFTDSFIWPRGFPLEYAHHPVSSLVGVAEQQVFSPIQQGLANGNPDVDAIYRLLFPLPHMFAGNRTIALGSNSYCPFNSQNTVWFKEAYPLLYLPSTCSFRTTDIWRSFIAQRICQENGWHILFHSPTVWQERNAHNLLNDFSDEIPGYLGNAKIWELLQATDIMTGLHAVHDNLRRVYICLVENGYFDEFELLLLDGWLSDLSSSKK